MSPKLSSLSDLTATFAADRMDSIRDSVPCLDLLSFDRLDLDREDRPALIVVVVVVVGLAVAELAGPAALVVGLAAPAALAVELAGPAALVAGLAGPAALVVGLAVALPVVVVVAAAGLVVVLALVVAGPVAELVAGLVAVVGETAFGCGAFPYQATNPTDSYPANDFASLMTMAWAVVQRYLAERMAGVHPLRFEKGAAQAAAAAAPVAAPFSFVAFRLFF